MIRQLHENKVICMKSPCFIVLMDGLQGWYFKGGFEAGEGESTKWYTKMELNPDHPVKSRICYALSHCFPLSVFANYTYFKELLLSYPPLLIFHHERDWEIMVEQWHRRGPLCHWMEQVSTFLMESWPIIHPCATPVSLIMVFLQGFGDLTGSLTLWPDHTTRLIWNHSHSDWYAVFTTFSHPGFFGDSSSICHLSLSQLASWIDNLLCKRFIW